MLAANRLHRLEIARQWLDRTCGCANNGFSDEGSNCFRPKRFDPIV